jgi:hypothetical protein
MIRSIAGDKPSDKVGANVEFLEDFLPRPELDPLAVLDAEHDFLANSLFFALGVREVEPSARRKSQSGTRPQRWRGAACGRGAAATYEAAPWALDLCPARRRAPHPGRVCSAGLPDPRAESLAADTRPQ